MSRTRLGAVIMGAAAAALFVLQRKETAPEFETPFEDFPVSDVPNSPLSAFLWMIRNAEHTRDNAVSGRAYNTFFGGAQFYDMSEHPVITGEMSGVRLSDQMCRNAGFSPGCVSTAAGAYQIIRPTWQRVRAAGAWGPRLDDFGPDSQDEAARRILLSAGALPLIEAGDIEGAVRVASKQWASLPYSTAGQPLRGLGEALAWYQEGLQRG